MKSGFFGINIDPTPAAFGPADLARLKRLCPQCLGQRQRWDKYGRRETCGLCDGTGRRRGAA